MLPIHHFYSSDGDLWVILKNNIMLILKSEEALLKKKTLFNKKLFKRTYPSVENS